MNPDCRRDARRVCGARGKRSAGSTSGFARTWTRRGIRRSRFPRDGSALHRERAKDPGVRARKGQTRSRRSRRNSRRGGAPDRSLHAWSGTYRVTLARICLVPSMIAEKQPTNAGETTRASLNARQNPRAEPEIERVELFSSCTADNSKKISMRDCLAPEILWPPMRFALASKNSRVSRPISCFHLHQKCTVICRLHATSPFHQPPRQRLGRDEGHQR